MKLSLSLPAVNPDGNPLTGAGFVHQVQTLERLGFDGTWSFDNIGRGFPNFDPITAVAAAAAATTRIMVGTGILQVPLRHPVELANRILTAHMICGDRLLLGVGAGSTRTDFEAVGQDYETRMQTLDRSLGIMRRLWNNEVVDGVQLSPRPATLGGPRILIGSWHGSRWIQRAAQEFDGWIGSARHTGAETLGPAIQRFRELGGTYAVVTNITVDLEAPDAEQEPHRYDLRCTPATARRRLRYLADLGYDEAVLVCRTPTEEHLTAIRALLP